MNPICYAVGLLILADITLIALRAVALVLWRYYRIWNIFRAHDISVPGIDDTVLTYYGKGDK